MLICIWNSYIKKSPLVTGLMRKTISHAGLQWSASLDGYNRYMDGRRECEEIMDSWDILDVYWYIYIYIYIYYLSNLLIFQFNNIHYTIVYWLKIVLYSLRLIVCNVSGSVAMATRNHSTNGAHSRSGHIKTVLGIGLRTRPRLISVSPRFIVCMKYISASRISSLFL